MRRRPGRRTAPRAAWAAAPSSRAAPSQGRPLWLAARCPRRTRRRPTTASPRACQRPGPSCAASVPPVAATRAGGRSSQVRAASRGGVRRRVVSIAILRRIQRRRQSRRSASDGSRRGRSRGRTYRTGLPFRPCGVAYFWQLSTWVRAHVARMARTVANVLRMFPAYLITTAEMIPPASHRDGFSRSYVDRSGGRRSSSHLTLHLRIGRAPPPTWTCGIRGRGRGGGCGRGRRARWRRAAEGSRRGRAARCAPAIKLLDSEEPKARRGADEGSTRPERGGAAREHELEVDPREPGESRGAEAGADAEERARVGRRGLGVLLLRGQRERVSRATLGRAEVTAWHAQRSSPGRV